MESADGFLRRQVFQLTVELLAEKEFGILRSLIPTSIAPRGRLADIPFAWTLTLVLALGEPISRSVRNKIRLISYELDYAHRNDQTEQSLIGFVFQVGGQKAIERLYSYPRELTPGAS
jgi:hypothetical protein